MQIAIDCLTVTVMAALWALVAANAVYFLVFE